MYEQYHKWFGIQPSEFPVSYYRLLGLVDFEQSAEVISKAADSRILTLRSAALGFERDQINTMMNEVSLVAHTLLDARLKYEYDCGLAAVKYAEHQQQTLPASPTVPKVRNRWRRGHTKQKSMSVLVLEIVLGGVLGLILAYITAYYLTDGAFDPLSLEPAFKALEQTNGKHK